LCLLWTVSSTSFLSDHRCVGFYGPTAPQGRAGASTRPRTQAVPKFDMSGKGKNMTPPTAPQSNYAKTSENRNTGKPVKPHDSVAYRSLARAHRAARPSRSAELMLQAGRKAVACFGRLTGASAFPGRGVAQPQRCAGRPEPKAPAPPTSLRPQRGSQGPASPRAKAQAGELIRLRRKRVIRGGR